MNVPNYDVFLVLTTYCRSNTTGNLRSYGETKCFSDGAEAYRDMEEFSRQFRNTKVTIKQGAIATDRVDKVTLYFTYAQFSRCRNESF